MSGSLVSPKSAYGQNSDFPSSLSYSKPHGFYQQPFELQVSVNHADAELQYTLDGSDPTTSATAKTVPSPATIHVDPDDLTDRFTAPAVCVRAAGFASGQQVTRLETFTFLFVDKVVSNSPDGQRPGPQWPAPNSFGQQQHINYGMDPEVYNDPRYRDRMAASLLAIPTMSVVTDLDNLFDRETGIFMNAMGDGIEWERPASLELLQPDGSPGFQINCGVRIRGGWSRHPDNPKHAFRFFFRGEYGEKSLDFPLFGDEGVTKFDKIDLRTSQNYAWAYKGGGNGDSGKHNTMLRDVFSRDTQRDMGMPYTRSRYYHLYLNGVYWGLFQTQERSEAYYAETYFGGSRDNYDVVKRETEVGGVGASDGNLEAWNDLWQIARSGFSDASYFQVQGLNPDGARNPDFPILVDVDNLITYMLCTFYVGDYDGPISAFMGNNGVNNFFGIFNRANPDGFKFFRHDAEHSMFLQDGAIPGAGTDRTGPYPAGDARDQFNPQWLHQQLILNQKYRLRFSDWVYKLFFNGGALTPEAAAHRLQARREQTEDAIIAESVRWGDAKVDDPRTYDNDWLPAVRFLFDDYLSVRTEMVLQQFRNKGWYPNIDPPKFNLSTGMVTPGALLSMSTTRGTIYYTFDGSEPSEGRAQEYTGNISVEHNLHVKARVRDGSVWSALQEAKFWVAEDVHELRITELHYHPLDLGDADNDSEFEFIEIKNIGAAEYDLTGVHFSDGIEYAFPADTTLQSGAMLVLAANAESFKQRYKFAPFGVYAGKLDNAGETIALAGSTGDTLVSFTYGDSYPWPNSADGGGYSVVVRSNLPGLDLRKPTSWASSAQINGSPGRDDAITSVPEPPQAGGQEITTFALFQNYPNPFNPETIIRFALPEASNVKLVIYNLLGQEVRTLINDFRPEGSHEVIWNARDKFGRRVASGIYLYRIIAGEFSQVKKLTLLR